LAIPQNGSGILYFTSAGVSIFYPSASASSGLTLISTTTIGTTVASVTVSGAFSATYDAYKIIITGGTGSALDADLNMTLGATTSAYYIAEPGANYSGGTFNGTSTNNGAAWNSIGRVLHDGLNMNVEVNAPFLAKNTFITGAISNENTARTFAGRLQNSTSYTAFTLTPSSGTLTGGTIRVYGYQNS
jgi:hypothetical protein